MKKWTKSIYTFFNRPSKWKAIYLPAIILGVFFFILTTSNIYSKTYNIEKFDRAQETIRSPITIENEKETERKTRETISAVTDRYSIEEEITKERINYVKELFSGVKTVNNERKKKDDANKVRSLEEKLVHLNEILSNEITSKVDDITLMHLMQINLKERDKGEALFVSAADKVLNDGVRMETLQSAQEEVKAVIQYAELGNEIKDVLNNLIGLIVVENSFFDAERTLEARNEAASAVDPVFVRSGDVLVRKGEIITQDVYDTLGLVGLLDKERKIFPALGLILCIGLIVSLLGYELRRLYYREKLGAAEIWAIILISVIVTSIMKIISLFYLPSNFLYLIVPVATGVLLLKLLIHERIAIVAAVVYAMIGSIIFNGEIPGSINVVAGFYFLFFQLTGIYFLTNVKDRLTLMKSCIGMAIINIMTVIIFIWLSFEKYVLNDFILQCSFGVGAAILSVVLTMGFIPIFETGLGILSDNRLLMLANPNQPLIKKILTEAPGTYHHSVMVANLSETACVAVGANGLLARVGSYYHDIGKTKNAPYFIENQLAIRNPHDFITGEKSAAIIIQHVTDGVAMLKEHKLPKEIIDIAAQHHGTSRVEYFYRLALQENKVLDETKFRYPGPKPQTKEAGIISICDAVEAAVRSLEEPSSEKIEEIVQSIVSHKINDGQLDETPLTLKEIELIKETVCESLNGIFHSRIQYPDEEERDDH